MKTFSLITVGLLAALLAPAAGCPEPEVHESLRIYGMTNPPPGRSAKIVNDEHDEIYTVRLSVGVAMALSCSDTCDGYCIAPEFHADNPDLLDFYESYYVTSGGTAWVITGKAPGTTQLHVSTACAEHVYTVTVVTGE